MQTILTTSIASASSLANRFSANGSLPAISRTCQEESGMRNSNGAKIMIDRNYKTASLSFRILDRKENKIYDTEISSGASWKAVLKAYLKNWMPTASQMRG